MTEGSRKSKKKTVLIVDDDEAQRDYFQLMVQQEGHAAITALSGEDALEIAAWKRPDLIILDFMLPGKGGFEVLQDLQDSDAAQTPVIVATAQHLEAKMVEKILEEPNVRGYLIKPVPYTDFVKSLKKVLGKSS